MPKAAVSPARTVAPVRPGRRSIGALGILALALGTLQSVVEPARPLLQRELVVAALTAGWVIVERRAATPMVDLRMLARPAMRSSIVLTFLVSIAFGMMVILLPQMSAVSADGYGFGLNTTDIGLLLLPGAIAGAVSDSVGGIAARRFGPRALGDGRFSGGWR